MIDIDLYAFQREAAAPENGSLSVTTILRLAGLVKFFVSRDRLAELAQQGKDVHMVCADIARGETDYWTGEWVEPYAKAFLLFCKEWDFRAEMSEQKVKHTFGYHGTLDMAGVIFADSKKQRRKAVVELKRAAPAKPYALQTAAYLAALAQQEPAYRGADRICVYLRPDGRYDADSYQNPQDWNWFLNAYGVAQLRRDWKLIDKRDDKEFDRIIHAGPVGDVVL